MSGSVLSIFLDLLMTGLLLATILYCRKLNARIRLLQDSRSELAAIIREFDECTTRATQNINEIHTATTRISDNIQLKIDKANFLAQDLDMLIERGKKLVNKPEPLTARSPRGAEPLRPAAPATSAMQEERGEQPRNPQRVRSRAEQELLSLLGGKKQPPSDG